MVLLKKTKEEKCPLCGMVVGKDALEKYGKKFCSPACLKEYEKALEETSQFKCAC